MLLAKSEAARLSFARSRHPEIIGTFSTFVSTAVLFCKRLIHFLPKMHFLSADTCRFQRKGRRNRVYLSTYSPCHACFTKQLNLRMYLFRIGNGELQKFKRAVYKNRPGVEINGPEVKILVSLSSVYNGINAPLTLKTLEILAPPRPCF